MSEWPTTADPRELIVCTELSRGRHSAVFLAKDRFSQREVAVKTATRESERTGLAIVREAEILSSLEHPGIARLIGLDCSNRTTALLTELVPGSTLASQVARNLDRTAPQVVALIAQLCEAVGAVHSAGFVHGDVNSRNVLVAPDNQVVLIDFGESRPIDAPSEPARAAPDFAAPELHRGAPATIASDVYSLGVVMSLLVRSHIDRHLSSHADKRVAALQEFWSALLDIIQRATERDPSRRYADVEEVLSAVQRLTGRPSDQTM
jgi:serine/threonine protein kinase